MFPSLNTKTNQMSHLDWIGTVCKQHLSLTMLPPNSMFNFRPSWSCTVSWDQRNTNHWLTCIENILMKPISNCCLEPFILMPKPTVFATVSSIECSVSTVITHGRPCSSKYNIPCVLESIPQPSIDVSRDFNCVRYTSLCLPGFNCPDNRHGLQ